MKKQEDKIMANNKVLIVDDDEHIVELIKLYMDKEGFDTVTANNGKKAVELFKSEAPAIVILDVMMPEMDGWQVCREIRRVSNIPIIMLTAKGETFDKVLGLELGADEEGGTVVRVSSNPNLAPEKFKSPQEIYNEGGMDAVVENATEKSELLLSLGVNMNLAPVADVSTNPSDYMYDRSLGQNAEVTADFVSKTVTAMNNAGIMSVLKHFPGYGGVGGDSHQGTVYDDKTAESIRENDLLPFKAGIEAGASSVLVAHNTVNALDSENPASLSPTIHNMLRDECGFDGVIMTDDIAMGAVADMENVYVKAVNAGNDLLITTDYQTGYNQILNAVKCGEISEETLNSAVERVLKMKGQI